MSTEERQIQIINEAIRIIHNKGYAALAIRELAAQVGVSEPAIYRHFSSKEDIIAGILDRIGAMQKKLTATFGGLSSARERIQQFIHFHFEYLTGHREITSVVFSEDIFQPQSVLKVKLKTIIDGRQALLKSLLEEGQREGVIKQNDVADLALLVLGAIRLLVLEWRLADFSFDLKKRGERLQETMENMIFV